MYTKAVKWPEYWYDAHSYIGVGPHASGVPKYQVVLKE